MSSDHSVSNREKGQQKKYKQEQMGGRIVYETVKAEKRWTDGQLIVESIKTLFNPYTLIWSHDSCLARLNEMGPKSIDH